MSILRQTLSGVVVVFSVAVCWACATQFTKSALTIDSSKFYAPYSMVWFNTCFMSVCYPVYLLYTLVGSGRDFHTAHADATKIFGPNGLTVTSYLIHVTPFVCLWIAANYSYSQSLGYISASAASSVFAVAFAIGGVVVISMDREFAGSVLGICLVLFSAFTAAVYKVMFKRVNGSANLGQVSLFMTGLGALDAVVNFVPTAILVSTGADRIEWDAVPWWALIGSAMLGLMYNFLVNFGIALLHPLVISVGMLCGIPLSAGIDIVFRGMDATPQFIVGAILILISFSLSTFPLDDLLSRKCRAPQNIEEEEMKERNSSA
ncbi:Protein Y73B6BL.31 b [Aphelenchoides avenae]|nr:Protein Y73B6BL.31 b [Aphelenchus avenae]